MITGSPAVPNHPQARKSPWLSRVPREPVGRMCRAKSPQETQGTAPSDAVGRVLGRTQSWLEHSGPLRVSVVVES